MGWMGLDFGGTEMWSEANELKREGGGLNERREDTVASSFRVFFASENKFRPGCSTVNVLKVASKMERWVATGWKIGVRFRRLDCGRKA